MILLSVQKLNGNGLTLILKYYLAKDLNMKRLLNYEKV